MRQKSVRTVERCEEQLLRKLIRRFNSTLTGHVSDRTFHCG